MGWNSGETHIVSCDAACTRGVWGCPSDNQWMTYDSSICTAAQALDIPYNIPFTVVVGPGQSSYTSCTVGGLTTNSYGNDGTSQQIKWGILINQTCGSIMFANNA